MIEDKFDGEFISYALGNLPEKMITEAVNSHKRLKIKWWFPAAVLVLVAVIIIPVSKIWHNEVIPLNINTIISAEYSAPLITSTIVNTEVNEDDVVEWLGFSLQNNLPREMKDYTLKYLLVIDEKTNTTQGVIIEGKLSDADIPRPSFRIRITEGKILSELLYDYDVTSDIDGITVIAGVMPGEYKTKRDGEVVYQPAEYYSSFDIGEYHCTIETHGQVSEAAFSEMNNILVDLLR